MYYLQTICKLEDSYGIHEMINEEKVNEKLGEIFMGPLWKKIGQWPSTIYTNIHTQGLAVVYNDTL